MYQVEKAINIPIGHRLSKHEGRCQNVHGHNIKVKVILESDELNENDMVIDFSDFKKELMKILDVWDHGMLLNSNDAYGDNMPTERVTTFNNCDPTAERMAEFLFNHLEPVFEKYYEAFIISVTIFENENSSATYYNEL